MLCNQSRIVREPFVFPGFCLHCGHHNLTHMALYTRASVSLLNGHAGTLALI